MRSQKSVPWIVFRFACHVRGCQLCPATSLRLQWRRSYCPVLPVATLMKAGQCLRKNFAFFLLRCNSLSKKKKKKSHCSFIRRRFSDPQLRRFHRPSRTRSAPQRVEHRVWGCGQCERGSHLAKLARVVDRFLFPLAVVSYRKPVGCAKGAYPVRLEQRFMETVVFFYKIVWIYWHL